jgi:alpha-L-fucosidase
MSQTRNDAERLQWFRDARFGMFVHWGLYSLIGRHEYAMNIEAMTISDYQKLAKQWLPRPDAPREWARLARNSGMRYMVLTTKHHDGFCLFDSKLTDFNAARLGPRRDLVAEFVAAARAEGLRVGLYFSPMDWPHPDGTRCAKEERARRRFVSHTHGLVRELMSNYGKIDIMWYDSIWPLDAEKLQSKEMNDMVRALQPEIIINNRSGVPEDFGTPEQKIEADKSGRMWEACMTMNEAWGYTPIDKEYKSAWTILSKLREVAAGGGNLLLNVGPSPAGDVPYECTAVLNQVGQWLRVYGSTIYAATDPVPVKGEHLVCGNYTRKGNKLYFHCSRWPGSRLILRDVPGRVRSVRLYGGKKLRFLQETVFRFTYPMPRVVISGMPELPPDSLCTVIEIEIEEYGVPPKGPRRAKNMQRKTKQN